MTQKQKVNWKKVYYHSYHRKIERFEPGEVDLARILVRREYPQALQRRRNLLALELFGIYDQDLKVPDRLVSETIYTLHVIHDIHGKTLREIAGEIRAYLSYHCCFHKEDGSPVEFSSILLAHKAVCAKEQKEIVKDLIYQ